MNTRVAERTDFPATNVFSFTRARALEAVGSQVLRYGLVLILVLFGTTKFTGAEAAAIKPLISNSPFMSCKELVICARAAVIASGGRESAFAGERELQGSLLAARLGI